MTPPGTIACRILRTGASDARQRGFARYMAFGGDRQNRPEAVLALGTLKVYFSWLPKNTKNTSLPGC